MKRLYIDGIGYCAKPVVFTNCDDGRIRRVEYDAMMEFESKDIIDKLIACKTKFAFLQTSVLPNGKYEREVIPMDHMP